MIAAGVQQTSSYYLFGPPQSSAVHYGARWLHHSLVQLPSPLPRQCWPCRRQERLAQIEVNADGFSLCEKRIDLLPEESAIFHFCQVKEREKLFLAMTLKRFAQLQEQARSHLRVEGRRSRLRRRRILGTQRHTTEQCDEDGSRAATHVHRLQDHRRPPMSAGLQ